LVLTWVGAGVVITARHGDRVAGGEVSLGSELGVLKVNKEIVEDALPLLLDGSSGLFVTLGAAGSTLIAHIEEDSVLSLELGDDFGLSIRGSSLELGNSDGVEPLGGSSLSLRLLIGGSVDDVVDEVLGIDLIDSGLFDGVSSGKEASDCYGCESSHYRIILSIKLATF